MNNKIILLKLMNSKRMINNNRIYMNIIKSNKIKSINSKSRMSSIVNKEKRDWSEDGFWFLVWVY